MITRKDIGRAWGGFSEGRLHVEKDDGTYDQPRYAIFPTKKAALRAYTDVRRVIIQGEL
jgi:hypothetical protein